jgi:hypothetical protein
MENHAWPSREEVKYTFTARYGAESDVQSWTTPFVHAVGLFEELELAVEFRNHKEPYLNLDFEDNVGERSVTEKGIERMGKEIVADLSSVSIGKICTRLAAYLYHVIRLLSSVMGRSLFRTSGWQLSLSEWKTGARPSRLPLKP